jgi:hypothetical protein
MAFKINEMLSAINSVGGLTKASKFMVEIFRPSANPTDRGPPDTTNGGSKLTFLCESAALPGIAYQSDEIKMSGYGNIEKRPTGTIFQDIPLTFYSDNDGSVIKYFHSWMQSIFAFNDATNPNGSVKNLPMNTFQYPNQYYGTVEITVLDETEKENKIIVYKLLEAYPIAIGDVQVDWNMQDQLLKIPVSFTYTAWTATSLDAGIVNNNSITRANSLKSTSNYIDKELKSIQERVGTITPIDRDRQGF